MKNILKLPFIILTLIWVSLLPVYAQDNEYHLDETFPIHSQGILFLSTDDAEVFVSGSDRKDAHVKIDRVVETRGFGWGERNFDIIISEEGGNLRIEDKEWGGQTGFMGYIREEYVIRIEIPYSVGLDLRGDDDDYEITNISGNIRVVADDSDIRLENCISPSYNFDVDDGDLYMKGATGELTVSMDDGDLTILGGALEAINIRSDDSDLDIETALINGGNYRFRIEDSSLEFHVTEGGGTFEIRHDDGRISGDTSYIQEEDEEHFSRYRLPGGTASIVISGDDLSVRLNSNIMN